MKVVVDENSIRECIRESTTGSGGWKTYEENMPSPVDVSAVVDPSAALTNPENSKFKPQNRSELKAVVSTMVDKISDDNVSEFYNALKKTLEDMEEKDKKMKNKENQKVESVVRNAVRKLLREAGELPPVKKVPYGVHGAEYMRNLEKRKADLKKSLTGMKDEEETATSSDAPAAGRERKNVMQTDVGGASFKEIAEKFGYASESGAKAAVERALKKAQVVAGMDPDELEIVTLVAMNDYIDFLKGSGELSSADVKLLKDHPRLVGTLDGFREFLDKSLMKAVKSA